MRMSAIIWIILTGWAWGTTLESYIVIAHGQRSADIASKRTRLEQTLRDNAALSEWIRETHGTIRSDQRDGFYMLRMGPFEPDARFARIYLALRTVFPDAIVLEQARQQPAPPSHTSPKAPTAAQAATARASHGSPEGNHARVTAVSAVSALKDTKTNNTNIWTALFGLAIIGILYMFLSSDQLRRIKREHAEIEARQKKLEAKQHEVLAHMGENIHALAKKTATRTQTLARGAHGTPHEADLQQMIEGENALLGMTGDLIKFLQIKSSKVTIQHAPFDFNNVLHEVAGTLHNVCRGSDKELVFDVDKRVPKAMRTDSLHMAQILTGLIEYLMCHTPSHTVRLHADMRSGSRKIPMLEIALTSDIGAINEAMFFDAHYDEASGTYVGLGLFVAKELIELMGGALSFDAADKKTTRLGLTFPVGTPTRERRQYHLPDPAIADKKVLIVDKNMDVARALKHDFNYFDMTAKILSFDAWQHHRPDVSDYDILLIDNRLFDAALSQWLRTARRKRPLRVISLENLYASKTVPVDGVVDVRMKKPVTQQHVFDVLAQWAQPDAAPPESPKPPSASAENVPEVFRGDFRDNPAIVLEDFACFSGQHIMIVEDNRINQKVLQGMLSKAGIHLTIANNGQEALDVLEAGSRDIAMILMDISMPVMDGFTATRRIHGDARFQSIPIVTLTALVSEHEVDKMFASGANGYLAKPLKIGRLFHAMERFLPTETTTQTSEKSPRVTPDTSGPSGLDMTRAMRAMQNDTLLYQEVLRAFKESYGRSDAVFEKLIRDTRYGQLKTLCIDLRGLTGSIGAKGLFEVVSEAQTMMLYNKHDLLERLIEPYRSELARLNEAINHYIL